MYVYCSTWVLYMYVRIFLSWNYSGEDQIFGYLKVLWLEHPQVMQQIWTPIKESIFDPPPVNAQAKCQTSKAFLVFKGFVRGCTCFLAFDQLRLICTHTSPLRQFSTQKKQSPLRHWFFLAVFSITFKIISWQLKIDGKFPLNSLVVLHWVYSDSIFSW